MPSPRVVYEMSASLDGYIADPDGSFDWGEPDEELHRFHNDSVRTLGGHLLGRRLYETMLFWETAGDDPSEITRDFAAIWLALPKVVVSRTLTTVEGTNTTLARADLRTELDALLAHGRDVAVAGAGLAADAFRAGLIDEVRLFTYPVAVGGGTPYFPRDLRLDLELIETRTFSSRVVHSRYRVLPR